VTTTGVLACTGAPSSCQPSATSTSPVASPAISAVAAPAGSAILPASTITFVPGSTTKLQQLVGEEDKERRVPTLSKTFTRYGIRGTDLGYSFEHEGLAYFLFGDTVGRLDRALDTIATTAARDPDAGVRLDFLTDGDKYVTIQPSGISMGPFEVPVSGIDLGGRMYVIVRTAHASDWSTDKTMLTRFTPPASFEPLRQISGRFLTMSTHVEPPGPPTLGLPPGGPYVLVWATAKYRQSDAYLFIVPAARFETGEGTLYYAGSDGTGAPKWSPRESDAAPIVTDGTLGDVSVTWSKDLGVWLMTYDHRAPRGIFFQSSPKPWGPWSPRQPVAVPGDVAAYLHDPGRVPDDGLGGPTIGKNDPQTTHGGMYAPYVVERWTKLQGTTLSLFYTLSTWNPYVVVLMKSQFKVQ
jgi:uncharacterized protein DUF4185